VLFVAIAVCVLAVVIGATVATRAAIRFSRRLTRLDAAIQTGLPLVERARELRVRADRIGAEVERVRAIVRVTQ
jgi:hypothetical protein